TQFAVSIGRDATNSHLLLTNGGKLISSGGFVGFGSTARSNTAVIAGAGSVWNSGNDFDFGGGNFNQVVVSNAGAIFDGDAIIGNGGGASNTMSVIGVGSVWSNNASLALDGTFNQLVISGGGRVSSSSGIIGGGSAAGHNTAIISGAGSSWSNIILTVGGDGGSSLLSISNAGAVLVSSEFYLGFDSTSTNNRAAVDGGVLRVTNAPG